jgi:RHS repeat-associated protein
MAAAAAANEVLILGSTVTGGTASEEGQRITADGFTPVVVDDPTWKSMTTGQFASYRAIVIGDPYCGAYGDQSHIAAAVSNTATWGAAVNGNVLIIGTDPVLHSGGTLTSSPGQLVSHGIDFALAQAGKVGAYIDLSCAYGTDPPNTPVALLDGIRPGGFSVDGGPSTVCYNDAHIVATHPALIGLTDAQLSNWGCSVHEAFDTWPGDYTVLAIARNFGSAYTASDGTIGLPYILASGQGLHSYPLSLAPTSQSAPAGTSATVTATLLDTTTGQPAAGVAISFRVQAGPNAGTAGSCTPPTCLTDSNGNVSWTYTGATPGSDTVQAWLDTNHNGVPDPGEAQTTAGITWTARAGPTPPETRGGGNPSEKNTQCSNGAPVNCATGEFWEETPDLGVPGRGLPFVMDRTYSSQLAQTDGPLGFGWTHNFNMFASVSASGAVDIQQENGSIVTFVPAGTGYTVAPRVMASLSRDSSGRYIFTRFDQTRFVFGADGKLSNESDRNGNLTSLSYDGSGHLTTISDPAGRQLSLRYIGSHLVQVVDPIGRAVSYSYDSAGQLIGVTDVGGGVTSLQYDSSNLVTSIKDPRGGVLRNVYDSSGRVISQTDPAGATTTWAYGPTSTSITDPNGFVVLETYKDGALISTTKAAGTADAATTTVTYDPATLGVATETDPNGHITRNTWDARGNLLSGTDPLGHTTTVAYNSTNDPISVVDPSGTTTTLTYDANGNLISATGQNASGVLSSFTLSRDPSHPEDVTAYTDPDGNRWSFSFDSSGNALSKTDPLGNTSRATYDSIGRMTSSITPRGNRTTVEYNAYGDPVRIVDPLGNAVTIEYDANRNAVASTDALGHTTRTSYDANNQTVQILKPDGTSSISAYDGDGNVVKTTDGLGRSTSYGFDGLDRLVTSTDPLGRITKATYDRAGNQVTLVDPAAQTTSYTFDAADQMTAISYSDGKTPNVRFTYDTNGHRLSMTDGTGTTAYTYDDLGRLTKTVDGRGVSLAYGYDRSGHVTSLTYADGSRVTRTYDPAGRPTSVSDWLGHTTTFAYDSDGHLVKESYPNQTVASFTIDAAGHLSSIQDAKNGAADPFLRFVYARNGDGLVTNINSAGVPKSPPSRLGYDPNNRLTQNKSGQASTYGYDAAYQLTSATIDDRVGISMTYDNGSQLTSFTRTRNGKVVESSRFTFDQNGNRTQQVGSPGPTRNYSYDQANRLVQYTGPVPGLSLEEEGSDSPIATVSYVYNGDGLRVAKRLGSSVENFLYDVVDGMPVIVQDGPVRYVTDPSGLPLEQVLPNGVIHYYHQDQLGSTVALTNSDGEVDLNYSYDDYGMLEVKRPVTANPFLFGGQYLDPESGLYQMRARYYDPATAQFLTVDPLAAATGVRYAYAADNPANFADPSGLACSPWPWNWADCVSGAAGVLSSPKTITAVQCSIGQVGHVIERGIDLLSGVLSGILAQRSIVGSLMHSISPNVRSAAGGMLRSAGGIVKQNPWIRSFAKKAPLIGLIVTFAVDLLSGESVTRATFDTLFTGTVGFIAGFLGSVICAAETVQTAGWGIAACPLIIGGLALIAGIGADYSSTWAMNKLGIT